MDASIAKEVCEHYIQRLRVGDRPAWLDLWVDDSPHLVVAYGRWGSPPFCSEQYVGKEAVAELIFGSSNKLEAPCFSNGHIFLAKEESFFWQFDLQIRTKDGFEYRNHILAKITVVGNKIKEFVEYGDPRRRGEFFYYLENIKSVAKIDAI